MKTKEIVPVEAWQELLFHEQFDCSIAVLKCKGALTLDGKVHVFINPNGLEEWLSENVALIKEKNITYETAIPLGMILKYVLDNQVSELLVYGLNPTMIFMVEYLQLLPLQDAVKAFSAMFAHVLEDAPKEIPKITKAEVAKVIAESELYFHGRMPSGEKGSYFGVKTIKREVKGKIYESIPVYLTKESADSHNAEIKQPVTRVKIVELARLYQGKYDIIVEPHRNYWVEFKAEELIG